MSSSKFYKLFSKQLPTKFPIKWEILKNLFKWE